MTLAWYGHLHIKQLGTWGSRGLLLVVTISWGLAFFEYLFQVPANRIGSELTGGPFNLFQLKILQEVITLIVFTIIVVYVFKSGRPTTNHLIVFALLTLAVFFAFRK